MFTNIEMQMLRKVSKREAKMEKIINIRDYKHPLEEREKTFN